MSSNIRLDDPAVRQYLRSLNNLDSNKLGQRGYLHDVSSINNVDLNTLLNGNCSNVSNVQSILGPDSGIVVIGAGSRVNSGVNKRDSGDLVIGTINASPFGDKLYEYFKDTGLKCSKSQLFRNKHNIDFSLEYGQFAYISEIGRRVTDELKKLPNSAQLITSFEESRTKLTDLLVREIFAGVHVKTQMSRIAYLWENNVSLDLFEAYKSVSAEMSQIIPVETRSLSDLSFKKQLIQNFGNTKLFSGVNQSNFSSQMGYGPVTGSPMYGFGKVKNQSNYHKQHNNQSSKPCFDYNEGRCNYGLKCKFVHKCQICGTKGHTKHECTKKTKQ